MSNLKRISDAVLGNEVYLYLNEDFPIEESIKNLKKNIEKLEKEINALTSRLSNPHFRDKAPKNVVKESESKLKEDVNTLKLLKKHLGELEG